MKYIERETYGFGPRLSTRRDRAAIAARILAGALVLGFLAGTLWN